MKHTEMNETSNREMITISRAEYEAMQAQLDAKSAELAQALLQNRWLMEQFAHLFNEAEAWDADSVEPTKKGEKKKPRKRKSLQCLRQ